MVFSSFSKRSEDNFAHRILILGYINEKHKKKKKSGENLDCLLFEVRGQGGLGGLTKLVGFWVVYTKNRSLYFIPEERGEEGKVIALNIKKFTSFIKYRLNRVFNHFQSRSPEKNSSRCFFKKKCQKFFKKEKNLQSSFEIQALIICQASGFPSVLVSVFQRILSSKRKKN